MRNRAILCRTWWKALLALSIVIFSSACGPKKPESELLVFAAASTAEVMTDLGRDFQNKTTGSRVRFSFGASRDLARQLRAGAPADILVSADAETVEALVADGFGRGEDTRRLASNRLVVIVPKDSPLVVEAALDLKKAPHIALGDPSVVPAGTYAKKWLERAGAWDELQDRVVPTIDVRAALAAVESGRAEAGVVYATDASPSPRVRIAYEVPKDDAPEIVYVAVRLSRSKQALASPFLEFLTGVEADAEFARRGFISLDQAR
jgi:molybdate transport system substrate-binding protein